MPAPKDAEFRRRSLTTRSTVWVRKVDSATPLRWPLGPERRVISGWRPTTLSGVSRRARGSGPAWLELTVCRPANR